MSEVDRHAEIIKASYRQLRSFFEDPNQTVYLYLDDRNKICNKRFASLLGYESPEEWAAEKQIFPTVFVHEDSQRTLVSAYQEAMQHFVTAIVDATWKRKSGGTVDTTVFLAPVVYEGHRLAMHFISETN